MIAPRPPPGRLFLVPNLLGVVPPAEVLPQRTIDVARALKHFVVETPKAARQFIKSLQSEQPIQSIDFATLDVNTLPKRVPQLLQPALNGEDLGLLSDAGCPGVADPGALLVAAAHRAGVRVVPLVGPSAVLLALMAAGMNGQQFAFHGYLPVAPEARIKSLKALDDAVARSGFTQIYIETPYRNDALLAATLAACRARTELCVAADLTLPTEQVIRRPIAQWRDRERTELSRRPAIFLLGTI
ncbi:MAG TPA: SAM-dependent methyltransferase [Candidatus Eremiobacteraceae bacterium]|nr:SAM-dependent methyltransferase [Candidatus Eremiobacteraceae bacterium]